jgi:DNA-binding SARP family transcriptional activator/tetratricopeptide (TPR) repeat protein
MSAVADQAVVIRVLGPIDLVVAGRTRTPSRLQRGLLAMLAAGRGAIVSMDRLVEVLWSGDPPRSAHNRVQALVSSLRAGTRPADLIHTVAPGYRLGPYSSQVDAGRFELLVERAREKAAAGEPAAAVAHYRAALDLWRGSAFDGSENLTDADVRAAVTRLEEGRLLAIEELNEMRLALGHHRPLTPDLTALVAAHPFRERLRGQLMLALARGGRSSEAMAVYRSGYELSVAELGIAPGTALQQLHGTLLAEDDVPRRGPTPVAGPAAGPVGDTRVVTIPADLEDFAGRTAEIARLRGLLLGVERPVRVVNIHGMGGVGKTSLAIRVAHVVMDQYRDGCVYFDMHGNAGSPADPYHVAAAVLRTFGVAAGAIPDDPDARVDLYRRVLAERQILLILDDVAEQRQVRALIPPVTRSAVLITSRRALAGVDGASTLGLDVVPTADALALLAGLVGPARVADEKLAAGRVVELCGRLPLAIRIIGVRLAHHREQRLAQVVERLSDLRHRLDELTTSDRAVRATIALSYTRLDPTSARLLRLLGLLPVTEFPGWVAQALLDESTRVAEDALTRLVDASLVTVGYLGTEVRYRMHDLIGVYGRDRADTDDPPPARAASVRRVFENLVRLAVHGNARLASDFPAPAVPPGWSAMTGDPDWSARAAVEWFDKEHALLVGGVREAVARGWPDVAWRLAAAMTDHVTGRGPIDEWRALVDLILSASWPTALEPEATPTLLLGLGGTLRGRGHLPTALSHLRRARLGFRRIGDTHRAGIAACQYGMAARAMGRLRESAASLRWAVERIDREQAAQHLTLAHIGLGNLHLDGGRTDEARVAYHRAQASLRAGSSPATESNVYVCLGVVASREGLYGEALDHFRRALRITIAIPDLALTGKAELALAENYMDAGDLPNARRYAERARDTLGDVGDVAGEARARVVIGQVHLADGDPAEAAAVLEAAGGRLRETGHPLSLARALVGLAHARLALRDPEAAWAAGQAAMEIYVARGRDEARDLADWLATMDGRPGPSPARTAHPGR